MNYAHRLEFGVAVPGDLEDPQAGPALARLAEELGYDLVSVSGAPGHADAWTLLSWIAATTSRIRLVAGGLSLAERDPAMLARAAASLDHLSGGRVELGLAGGDEPDRVAEAIDVVHALWNAGERGLARYDGTFYRLAGARKAAPAHEIPVTVRGSGADLLRVIGAKADGWSGTDGHLAASRIIDDAARAAGRAPREIRRVLEVDDGSTDLLPLIGTHGVGTIVLRTTDREALTRFAREVAPALRAAVDATVPHGSSGLPVRKAAALARRRNGIDYDAVPASLAEVIEPGDLAYYRFRSGYLRGGAPGIVLRAATPAQVADALAFARRHPGLPLSIRSAGHGISGRSTNDGGIVLDVSLLDGIEVVDEAHRRVRIGPGARWMDVAAALAPYGWALSSGDYGGVGVGGLATAGGIGFLGRAHGLTIDHLREVEIVLADGSLARAGDTENPDLFWAVRGAGANFGIVTSFEFEADEVGPVGFAQLISDASDPAGFLERWGRIVESSPRDLTSFLVLGPPRRGQPWVARTLSVVDSAEPETVLARLQPIADIAPLYGQQAQILPYAAVMANASADEHRARGEPISRSGLLDHITPEFAAAAARVLGSGGIFFFEIRSVGGAIADVSPCATAYAHRSANFQVVAMGTDDQVVDALWAQLTPFFDGLYLSFESSLRPGRIADAFPPRTLARLRDLKAKYDPDNVFRDNFNIRPGERTT